MNDETIRIDFEYWYEIEYENIHGPLVWINDDETYENTDHSLMWFAYLAGRKAQQACGAEPARN